MTKRLTLAYRVLGLQSEAERIRECRRGVKQRLKALPPGPTIPAVIAGRELILRRCRTCQECWLGRL